jgi:hypothetical protein
MATALMLVYFAAAEMCCWTCVGDNEKCTHHLNNLSHLDGQLARGRQDQRL